MFFLAINLLENLDSMDFRFKVEEKSEFLFQYDISLVPLNKLLIFSKRLFFGFKFLHSQQLSINGDFEIYDFIYNVEYINI